MTIGKNSRRSSARSSIRAPKFLDKSSGLLDYGRLDEPEAVGEEGRGEARGGGAGEKAGGGGRAWGSVSPPAQRGRDEAEVSGFGEGLMEDDGESLLRRKPGRRSSRWRRSSRRKQKEGRTQGEEGGKEEEEEEEEEEEARVERPDHPRVPEMVEQTGDGGREAALVHFPAREDRDDQVLIRDKKRGREEEGEEEARMRSQQEEGMKVVKRATMKTYRKALDRAFRRGWEAFITNLYSVTLTPVSPSSPSSPSLKKKHQHSGVLAECQ